MQGIIHRVIYEDILRGVTTQPPESRDTLLPQELAEQLW